jgi:hypothetical protein
MLSKLTDAVSRILEGNGARQLQAADKFQSLPENSTVEDYATANGLVEAQNMIDRAVEAGIFATMKRDEVIEAARELLGDIYGDVEPLILKKQNGKSALVVVRIDPTVSTDTKPAT